ncbi:MAG: hypothetical protein AAF763_11145 [Pseudomonadota bacterium]
MFGLSAKPGRILALLTDGVAVAAAVYRGGKAGAVEREGTAFTREAEAEAALADILAQLEAAGVDAPKRAVLATDRAVFARVDLPVDPDRPRPFEQMRELARWEAEPLFSELPNWTFRDVLLSQGAISPQDDARVLEQIEARGGGARYADVAAALKLVPRGLRDGALETQERLAAPVTLAACGWRPALPGVESSGAQHPWLISAVAEEERARWAQAFASRKIAFAGLVPSWGLGPPATAPDEDETALVIERHAKAILVKRVSAAGVEALRLAVFDEDSAAEARALRRLLDDRPSGAVTAYGFAAAAQDVIRDAAPQARFAGLWETAALASIAAQSLGAPADAAPLIDAKDPSPPIYKNPDFYRGVMAAGVLLAIVGWDSWTRVELWRLDSRFQRLEQEYEQKRVIAQAIQRQHGEVESLEARIAEAETALEAARAEHEVAAYLLTRRPQLTTGLLDAVRTAAAGDVVVSALREAAEPRESFVISAWALREIEAERFVSALNRQLAPLRLSVADESLERGVGARGLRGFTVKLRIAPAPLTGPVSPAPGGAPAAIPPRPIDADAPRTPAKKAEVILR